MARRGGSNIFTVFGQIEAAVADAMIAEGKATRIEVKDFPTGVNLVNDVGYPARFAVIIGKNEDAEFARRVAALKK